ncbi:MAG TPA: cyclic nucleotide-binding domain-containing protein [Gaiellaceae bacterium]|jgi:CRP-like cAMP-binding protein
MTRPTPDLLRKVPLFSTLDDPELERIASEFRERSFAPGDAIAIEGAEGLTFFVIEDGEVTITAQGKEVARLGPGDHFGEIALVDKGPRTATVTAATDMRAHMLPIWSFRPIVEGNPALGWKLLESLAGRLRTIEERPA